MKLETFRIRNCFGFVDSREIELGVPGNLVYFLGRNSSGKTSVLRAISYFEHGKVPQEQPNFHNYENLEGVRYLQARYSVDPSEGQRLSLDTIMTGVIQRFGNTPLRITLGEEGYSVEPQIHGTNEATALLNHLSEVYSELIGRIHEQGQVWIDKNANGSYEFLIERDNYDDFKARKQTVGARIGALNSALAAGGQTRVVLDFDYIEGLLFIQFPETYFFTDRFSLDENLPRSLQAANLQEGRQNNALTEAFVSLLGSQTLRNLLFSTGRRRVPEFARQVQDKLDALCAKINEDAARDAANADFVRIFVDRTRDVRIVLEVDGKESYYEHLSDNTKFLVAYHIFQEDRVHKNAFPSTLLFDEPSKGFHPSAETKVLSFLESLADQGNQVFVTTHSQHLIDLDRLSAVRIMTRAEDGSLQVDNKLHGVSGPGRDTLALQPITDAIGLRYASQTVVRDKIVVVEGYTDLLYLRFFARLLRTAEPNIAPVTGDSKIPTFLPFLISQGISFKIVVDSSEMKNRIQRAVPVSDNSFFVVEQHLADRAGGSIGIEDLFSRADFRMLLERYGHEIDERRFERVSNSNYAKTPGLKAFIAREIYEGSDLGREHFSEETIENFETLLRFCENAQWFRV